MTDQTTVQRESAGGSTDDIHEAALAAASPVPGLSWVDIGCGTGNVLRAIKRRYDPQRLVGVDILDWLDDDLRDDVDVRIGPAETALEDVEPADRVLLVETIEHLEAPWTVLRAAARRVVAGGTLVVTTPNVASLRHRLELALSGQLTTFRPGFDPHLTPALPHVTARILREEGLEPVVSFAGRDKLPKLPQSWPPRLHRRFPALSSVSVVVAASRP